MNPQEFLEFKETLKRLQGLLDSEAKRQCTEEVSTSAVALPEAPIMGPQQPLFTIYSAQMVSRDSGSGDPINWLLTILLQQASAVRQSHEDRLSKIFGPRSRSPLSPVKRSFCTIGMGLLPMPTSAR